MALRILLVKNGCRAETGSAITIGVKSVHDRKNTLRVGRPVVESKQDRQGFPRLGAIRALLGAVLVSAATAATAVMAADVPVDVPAGVRVETSKATGVARFVIPDDGGRIAVSPRPGRRQLQAIDFFHAHGALFGVTGPDNELAHKATKTDEMGWTHTTFQQMHEGVEVFAALLRVHQDDTGRVQAVNGTFIPDIQVSPQPVLSGAEAVELAIDDVAKTLAVPVVLGASEPKLMVFRANLARGIPGMNHLVYEVEVSDAARSVREFVYVDAHKPQIVDMISGIHESIHRRVYQDGFGAGFLIWAEGDSAPVGIVDVDHLIDYSLDTYNVIASMTNGTFLSWDGADGIMHAVNAAPIGCPNASWNGTSTNFCLGVTADDTVAHEWGHAYTDATHNLIYQWQSGALNESYSDIFGEVVDILNGAGLDSPDTLREAGACSVFRGLLPPDLTINAPGEIAGAVPAAGAQFNPFPPITITGDLELVNDNDDAGGGGSVTDACEALVGFTAGNIALIDRGSCAFGSKVLIAQNAGAIGAIIVNIAGDAPFFMGGTNSSITIPSAMVGLADGNIIKAQLPGVDATLELRESTDVSYRWLSGEDDPSFGGAIRDMWNPNCFGDPGKVSDLGQYTCSSFDNGGVHTNSGVPNHAFALLVDGGDYNGEAIQAIGLTKTFHIYWRAAEVYQGPATNFADHADALLASCSDLIGANLFALSTEMATGVASGEFISGSDCVQVSKVIDAVELRMEPTQCAFEVMLQPDVPAPCDAPGSFRHFVTQDWELGIGGWIVGTRELANPATFDTPDWAVVGLLPPGRTGQAAFVGDLAIGNCGADTEAGVLFLESPAITLPDGAVDPRMSIDHWVATELLWDGGNVKINVNGGGWALIPSSQFLFNPYPTSLNGPGEGNDNPLGGEEAFTGTDGGEVGGSWGQSQISLVGLAGPGDDIQLRFEMGLDGCNGVIGWFVDDVRIYYCCPYLGDAACDGEVGDDDHAMFADCYSGMDTLPDPQDELSSADCLAIFDTDIDDDLDLRDYAGLQNGFGVQ